MIKIKKCSKCGIELEDGSKSKFVCDRCFEIVERWLEKKKKLKEPTKIANMKKVFEVPLSYQEFQVLHTALEAKIVNNKLEGREKYNWAYLSAERKIKKYFKMFMREQDLYRLANNTAPKGYL